MRAIHLCSSLKSSQKMDNLEFVEVERRIRSPGFNVDLPPIEDFFECFFRFTVEITLGIPPWIGTPFLSS